MANKITRLILACQSIRGVKDRDIIQSLDGVKANQIDDTYGCLLDLSFHHKYARITGNKNIGEHEWGLLLNKADKMIMAAAQKDIKIINCMSSRYPKNLLNTADKNYPPVLYVKGNTDILNTDKSIAIIGTRKATKLGAELTRRYTEFFVRKGYVIVSGLALGTDTNAHKATLASGGKTVAILAHGLNEQVYPYENRQLAQDIVNHGGAVISTYPINEELRSYQLAARDKWQSGMSDGVIAVESTMNGGSRITMSDAHRQGRPLAAPDMTKYLKCHDYNLPFQNMGTYDAIKSEVAEPLYTRRSVFEFEELLRIGHQMRDDHPLASTKPFTRTLRLYNPDAY